MSSDKLSQKDSKLVQKAAHDKNWNILDKIKLTPQETAGVLTSATVGTIASFIPGINKFFEWVERAGQISREEKLKILFKQYSANFDSIDDALSKLKLLITTRGGQTLFRKIIQIIDKGPEDEEWIQLLSRVLKNISNKEFEKYFEEEMYTLSQIDRLSPQALILISKYDVWRKVNIQGTTTTSGFTMGDWAPQVTRFLTAKIGGVSLHAGGRINHSFRELESTGMLELKSNQLKLTAIGLEIHISFE